MKAIDNKVWAQNISELRGLPSKERKAKFFLLRMNLSWLGCPGAKATHQPWKYASFSNKQNWAEILQTDVERPVSENKNAQITHTRLLKSWEIHTTEKHIQKLQRFKEMWSATKKFLTLISVNLISQEKAAILTAQRTSRQCILHQAVPQEVATTASHH